MRISIDAFVIPPNPHKLGFWHLKSTSRQRGGRRRRRVCRTRSRPDQSCFTRKRNPRGAGVVAAHSSTCFCLQAMFNRALLSTHDCILIAIPLAGGRPLCRRTPGPFSMPLSTNSSSASSRTRYHLFAAENLILPGMELVHRLTSTGPMNEAPPISAHAAIGHTSARTREAPLGARAASPLSSSGPSAAQWVAAT